MITLEEIVDGASGTAIVEELRATSGNREKIVP